MGQLRSSGSRQDAAYLSQLQGYEQAVWDELRHVVCRAIAKSTSVSDARKIHSAALSSGYLG